MTTPYSIKKPIKKPLADPLSPDAIKIKRLKDKEMTSREVAAELKMELETVNKIYARV